MLLDNFASAEVTDSYGNLPHHYASQQGAYDNCRLLLTAYKEGYCYENHEGRKMMEIWGGSGDQLVQLKNMFAARLDQCNIQCHQNPALCGKTSGGENVRILESLKNK